ncbi:MAG: hypothetical protein Q4C46_01505 [Bacillota bacterium]|nr:hypothetical protein [Bacillota bacterium]
MILIILALLFGIAVLALLVRSLAGKQGSSGGVLYKILKIILLVESAAFVVLFIVVLIKTLLV